MATNVTRREWASLLLAADEANGGARTAAMIRRYPDSMLEELEELAVSWKDEPINMRVGRARWALGKSAVANLLATIRAEQNERVGSETLKGRTMKAKKCGVRIADWIEGLRLFEVRSVDMGKEPSVDRSDAFEPSGLFLTLDEAKASVDAEVADFFEDKSAAAEQDLSSAAEQSVAWETNVSEHATCLIGTHPQCDVEWRIYTRDVGRLAEARSVEALKHYRRAQAAGHALPARCICVAKVHPGCPIHGKLD